MKNGPILKQTLIETLPSIYCMQLVPGDYITLTHIGKSDMKGWLVFRKINGNSPFLISKTYSLKQPYEKWSRLETTFNWNPSFNLLYATSSQWLH